MFRDRGARLNSEVSGYLCVGGFVTVALKEASFDVDVIARKGLGYERLDQLVVDLLLGAR